ncbi:hypothetical protein PG989_016369 [Apiospora arundinis]
MQLPRCHIVTGAAAAIYTRPDISTLRIVKELGHLPESQKEVWVSENLAEGGLQGKVGAWRLAQQRTFAFLDRQIGIHRPTLLDK